MDIALLITWVLIALLFSFLCSIYEAVLLSVTPGFIASGKEKNDKTALLLDQLKSDIDRPLAAILTLNTIAHTVGASLAGVQAGKVFDDAWLGAFTAVFTLLVLIGSEIIPKTIGATYWRGLAGFTARSVRLLVVVLLPFIWLCQWVTQFVGKGHNTMLNREEFAAMAQVAEQSGHIEREEGDIVRNLFSLRETAAEEVMTPRTVLFTLQEDTRVSTYLENHAQSPFSRVPLYRKNRDDLDTFVLRSDILLAHALGHSDQPVSEMARPLLSVSKEETLDALFALFMSERHHLAAVRDGFGSVVGLVTLEDVVETLLGQEIVDEGDHAVDLREEAKALWEQKMADNERESESESEPAPDRRADKGSAG